MKNFFKKMKKFIEDKKKEINFKLSAYKVRRSTKSLLRYYIKCLRFCFDITIKIGFPVNEKEFKQLDAALDLYDSTNEKITEHFEKCKMHMNDYIYYNCDDEDTEFNRFRDECHSYMVAKENAILKKWLEEIGGKYEPIGYYRNMSTNTMEIYTKRPGMIIGKRGTNIESLKKMLADEFHGEWDIKLIEVRGGFINTLGRNR